MRHKSFALAPGREAIVQMFGSAEAGKAEILGHWEAARRHAGDSRINVEGMRRQPFPYPHSLPGLTACKAAELQAGQEGHWRYFDRVQQAHVVECRNIADPAVLIDLAGELGLDVDRFAADLAGEGARRAVLADCQEAQRLGIHAVPTVLIGRRSIQGAVPVQTYTSAVGEQLIPQA